jgi:hypothetical protein
MIGQELRARYEVPQDLPHEMLTILTQLNSPLKDEKHWRRAAQMRALPFTMKDIRK